MAATDFFLKIDGIEGESQDSKHSKEIEIDSWSLGATQSGSFANTGTSGGGAGKVDVQDFHFTKKVSTASPKLFQACCQGAHIKSVVLTCRKAGKDQQEYLKITMSDCIVSGCQMGVSGSSIIPVDQVSLDYAKIEFEHKEQKPDGTLGASVKKGFDLKKMVSL